MFLFRTSLLHLFFFYFLKPSPKHILERLVVFHVLLDLVFGKPVLLVDRLIRLLTVSMTVAVLMPVRMIVAMVAAKVGTLGLGSQELLRFLLFLVEVSL